jgi:hypothetical protein
MGTCAYLDLLGFEFFVKNDPDGALKVLQNYQVQLSLETPLQPSDSYLDPYRLDSFKYMIPFSDSIFLYADDPSKFVLQLANFVNGSFSFTSDAFASPEDPNHPEKVTEKMIVMEEGHPVVKNLPANWYPVLFRGGIGYGDAMPMQLNGIHDGIRVKTPFIFGQSVIEAVRMELSSVPGEKIKGPRLLCSRDFHDALDERAQRIVHPAFDEPNLYEVNWTAVHYLMSDELTDFFVRQLLINDFSNIFRPAANLWRAYRTILPIEPHYRNFLKLIVIGLQHFLSGSGFEDKGAEFISTSIEIFGIAELRDFLLR